MSILRHPLRLLALVCLMLCLSVLPALAEVTEGNYSYHYDESIGGVVITSYVGTEADVTVPEMLGGYPVRSLAFNSFSSLSALTTVRLPDNLRYLDGGAFTGCSNLKTLYLPENLLEIQHASMVGNYMTYVGKDTSTAKLLINEAGSYPSARFIDPAEPDMQIYYIANANTGEPELGLYNYMGQDEIVHVPDGVMHLYDYAFRFNGGDNASIRIIYTPDSVVSVGMQTFYSLPNLEEVHLSANISTWKPSPVWAAGTFDERNRPKLYCSSGSITMSTLTSKVTTLGIIDPAEPDFSWSTDEQGRLILMGYYGSASSFTVPDGVVGIGKEAFYDLPNLETIIVPDSVTSIGMRAFDINWSTYVENPAAYRPQRIYLPDGITSCGLCIANTERSTLYFSRNSVTDLNIGTASDGKPMYFIDPSDPDWAWQGNCSRTICGYYGQDSIVSPPEDALAIGDSALCNLPFRITLIMPDNLSFSASSYDPYKVTLQCSRNSAVAAKLEAMNNDRQSPSYAFADPQWPGYLLAPYENELYFAGYTGTDSVINIPPIVDAIAGHINLSTPNRDSIKYIHVPEGVRRLADRAFCDFLFTDFISLPSSLETIGEYAFSNCSLKALIIPEGITSLPAHMTDNSIIRHVTIPKSVTSIHSTALTTSGPMRVYKIYCNKGSYAAAWAKAKKVDWISYFEDNEYTIVTPEQNSFYVGDYFDWRSTLMIMPYEPDFPYTLELGSSKPKVARVENNEVSFIAPGTLYLTITSPELETSAKMPNIRVYQPIKSFSVPEYHFFKYPSPDGVLSVHDVAPAKNTNPTYVWIRYETTNLGQHTAGVEDYELHHISEPGVYSFDVTSHNGITKHTTLYYVRRTDGFSFASISDELGLGLRIKPQITITIGSRVFKNAPGSYTLTSSDPSIISITDDGALHLLAPGTATITATSFCGDVVSQTLTVSDKRVYALPDSTTVIGAEAFIACPADKIIIPEGCTTIGARAFADCGDLAEIVIPESVSSIADNAFSGSTGVVILAPAGSFAASYAAQHGIPCTTH